MEQQEQLGTPAQRSETAVELSYLTQISKSVAVQPDLQYIVHSNTDPAIRNALAFLLRFEVSFYGRYITDPLRLHPCNRLDRFRQWVRCYSCSLLEFTQRNPVHAPHCPFVSGGRHARRLCAGETVCATAAAAGGDRGDGPQGNGAGYDRPSGTHIPLSRGAGTRPGRRHRAEARVQGR